MLLDRVRSDDNRCDDELELAWWELDRRAFEKTTKAGMRVRVLLPLGLDLQHGDVLSSADAAISVRVCLRPSVVLGVTSTNATEIALLALELGNLHAPTEIVDGGLRTIPDGPAERAICQLGLSFERQLVRFRPRRCAGTPQVRIADNFRVVGP